MWFTLAESLSLYFLSHIFQIPFPYSASSFFFNKLYKVLYTSTPGLAADYEFYRPPHRK